MIWPAFARRRCRGWELVLAATFWNHAALADALELRIAKESLLQSEPIVGIATLRTGSATDKAESDANDWMVRQPIRRHLRMIMYRDESPVCSSAAFFLEFFQCPPSEQGQTYEASIFRIPLQRRSDAPRSHEYCKDPGKYVLVLADIEHRIESNKVPIEILATPPDQAEAMSLFCAGEERAGAMQMILQHRADADVEEAFQRLADLYPDSIYGRYVRTGFALRFWDETFKSHNLHGGEAAWGAVVAKLLSSAPLLEEWNPLRHKAELALARAQVWAGSRQDARFTLEKLKSQSPTGELAGKVWSALGELDKSSP